MTHIDVWKQVEGWPSYEVSDTGRVRNKESGCVRKPNLDKFGYLSVDLYNKGYMKRLKIHRLVLITFSGIDKERVQVNHINGNKQDNKLENLEWCTPKENSQHAYRTGLTVAVVGEKHGMSKLTVEEVLQIRQCVGQRHQSVADRFGVSRRLVSKILKGDLWKEKACITV